MKLKKILVAVSVVTILTSFMPFKDFNIINDFSVVSNAETLENGLSYEVSSKGTGIIITGCDSSVTEIEIPAEIDGLPVVSFGVSAFSNCQSLKSITIPHSIEFIGAIQFQKCTSLMEINVDEKSEYFSSENGVLFNKQKTKIITYPCSKSDEIYTIPDSVVNIGYCAFYGCTSLSSVIIPNSITKIDGSTFSHSSLTEIKIPDSVTNIGVGAFLGTPLLENQTTDVKYADKWVIDCNEQVTEAEIREDTLGIAYGSFMDCTALTSIKIPNGVKYIGDDAFYNCNSLTSITIPDSVISIGELCFFKCVSLKEAVIPGNMEYLGYGFAGYYYNETYGYACPIFDEPWIVNVSENSPKFIKVEDFTIKGYTGSIVETYANANGFNFISIGTLSDKEIIGDMNSDGKIASDDALNILQLVVNPDLMTEEKKAIADVDNNGEITSYDALLILQIVVGVE